MRARNIKPGFFKNEELVELPFETRLLFVGLWLMADRDGRMEDRPKRIKMELFPADSVDIESMLEGLTGKGLILRYEVDSKRFISIPAWSKHQNPHVNEKASTIPAPEQHSTNPADSLIPDSLIPDSPCRARKRAPKGYRPPDDVMKAMQAETGLGIANLEAMLREMKDHEFAKPRRDWDAVFRNWVRKALKFEQKPNRKLTYSEQLHADLHSKGMIDAD